MPLPASGKPARASRPAKPVLRAPTSPVKPLVAFPTAFTPGDPRDPLAKQLKHYEHGLQVSIVKWQEFNVHPDDCVLLAIPNGGGRSAAEAARLKAEGVLAGASDLVLLLPGGRTHWPEIKLEKTVWHEKTYQKPDQKAFEARCLALGHAYSVIRSLDEWGWLLDRLGVPYRSRPMGPSRGLRG